MCIFDALRDVARRIKRDALTLWFASRHPATPLLAKFLCAFVVAYALSPIDLIPDFIPILGYVDDVVLLPALIWSTIRLLPRTVLEVSRRHAAQWMAYRKDKPRSWGGAVVIVAIWLGLTAIGVAWAVRAWSR